MIRKVKNGYKVVSHKMVEALGFILAERKLKQDLGRLSILDGSNIN